MVTVYTTVGTEAAAKDLARALLDERLVACVNLLPMQSIYRWEGKVQEEPEIGMLLKTERGRLDALFARLPEMHPYDVPCIEVFGLDRVHPAFGEWVREETVV